MRLPRNTTGPSSTLRRYLRLAIGEQAVHNAVPVILESQYRVPQALQGKGRV